MNIDRTTRQHRNRNIVLKTVSLAIASLAIAVALLVGDKKQSNSQLDRYIQTIDRSLFRSGDLIFRQGNGVLSQAVRSRDRASEFSHVGIVKVIENQPYVIHASIGEPVGTNAVVKMETLADYLQDSTSVVGLYRLKTENAALAVGAADLAYQYSLEQIPFDSQFSLKSEDKFYCTELVWKVYLKRGLDLVDKTFTQLSFPFDREAYILPSGLIASQYIQEVARFQLP